MSEEEKAGPVEGRDYVAIAEAPPPRRRRAFGARALLVALELVASAREGDGSENVRVSVPSPGKVRIAFGGRGFDVDAEGAFTLCAELIDAAERSKAAALVEHVARGVKERAK